MKNDKWVLPPETERAQIRCGLSCRTYESGRQGLTLLVYAGGPGEIWSTDAYSKFSHISYILPAEEVTIQELDRIEAAIRDNAKTGYIVYGNYTPDFPVSRRVAEEIFCGVNTHAALVGAAKTALEYINALEDQLQTLTAEYRTDGADCSVAPAVSMELKAALAAEEGV